MAEELRRQREEPLAVDNGQDRGVSEPLVLSNGRMPRGPRLVLDEPPELAVSNGQMQTRLTASAEAPRERSRTCTPER